MDVTITSLSSRTDAASGVLYTLKALAKNDAGLHAFWKALGTNAAFDHIQLIMAKSVTGVTEFELEIKPQKEVEEPAAPAPALKAPTSPLKASDNKEFDNEKIKRIAQESFGAFPWRMELTRTNTKTKASYASVFEAQSSNKIHAVMEMPIDADRLKMEVILIDSDFYVKLLSASPEVAKEMNLSLEEWQKLDKKHPDASFRALIQEITDPSQLMDRFGFSASELESAHYKHTGTEKVGEHETNIYGITIESEGGVTYRQWIGAQDHRIYRIEQELSDSSAVVDFQYDSAIVVNKPSSK